MLYLIHFKEQTLKKILRISIYKSKTLWKDRNITQTSLHKKTWKRYAKQH